MNPDEMPDQKSCSLEPNWPEFQRDLAALINRYSLERPSNTPDFVLAEYLTQCLVAYNIASTERERLCTQIATSSVVELR